MLSRLTKTARSLIVANIIGGAAALAFGWSVPEIMLAYWLENLAIGLLNIVKMAIIGTASDVPVQSKSGEELPKSAHLGLTLFTIPFFIVHYGGFMAGHGVFLAVLFDVDFADIRTVLIIFIPLLAHHIYSFIVNFIGKKEYQGKMVMMQMFSPYARIVVLHLAIVFGGALVMFFGSGIFGVAILIVGKIVVDTTLHLYSHAKAPLSSFRKKIDAEAEAMGIKKRTTGSSTIYDVGTIDITPGRKKED